MFRPENAQSLAGLGFVIAVCWALSENKKAFPWRLALGSIAVQIGLILLLYWVYDRFVGASNIKLG